MMSILSIVVWLKKSLRMLITLFVRPGLLTLDLMSHLRGIWQYLRCLVKANQSNILSNLILKLERGVLGAAGEVALQLVAMEPRPGPGPATALQTVRRALEITLRQLRAMPSRALIVSQMAH